MHSEFSFFGEIPFRLIDPEIQENTGGLGDSNIGFKYALLSDYDHVATAQLRAYIPSGDGSRGLGNDHVTIEPGLLMHRRLSCDWAVDGELRLWIPIDGTDDFAGSIIRYGLGASYRVWDDCDSRLWAVAEFVGWTVLGGRSAVTVNPQVTQIESAAGETIVNAKFGLRWAFSDSMDAYAVSVSP